MDRAQPLLKRRRPHRSRRKHVGAGFEISAILDSTRQISVDDLDSFERHAIGERVKRVHAIGFKAMGKRVHSGRHRQERRKSDRQFRIFNGDLGQHQGMEDDLFLMGVFAGNHTRAADLRAGSGRRRHGNDRGYSIRIGPRPPVANVLEIPYRPGLRHHEGHAFADVQR